MSTAGATSISELTGDAVCTVGTDATLLEVARALSAADIGALAVSDGGKVQAIISERDVVRALADGRDPAGTRTIDVAHNDLVWCDVDATVAEVAEEMTERYIRHVLVEDDGRLVGIVSARDLLGIYASVDMAEDD